MGARYAWHHWFDPSIAHILTAMADVGPGEPLAVVSDCWSAEMP